METVHTIHTTQDNIQQCIENKYIKIPYHTIPTTPYRPHHTYPRQHTTILHHDWQTHIQPACSLQHSCQYPADNDATTIDPIIHFFSNYFELFFNLVSPTITISPKIYLEFCWEVIVVWHIQPAFSLQFVAQLAVFGG